MKFWSTLLVASSSIFVEAFPTLSARNLEGLTSEKLAAALKGVEKYQREKRLVIDPSIPINANGTHTFRAPNGTDQRGPCPGLNALANHDYISHDGITTLAEVVTAINQVYGMGLDLALILGVMGTVWTGNPVSLDPGFSIGGYVEGNGEDNILDNLFGLLGTPRGLQGSHNWIESDSSLTRNDLYVTGNAWTMNTTLFWDIHDRADSNGVISLDLLAAQAARRFEYSKAHNPNFYYGPVTGMIARNAGYLFLGNLLANHTSEKPLGMLTQEVFRSFFAVFDDGKGGYEYKEGHETIPQNWYRRVAPYGLVELNLDTVDWILQHPELGSIGGNTGTVNSFTGLDLSNVTGGVVNAATLLKGNNLLCFSFEVLKTFLPNSLSPLLSTLAVPINMVENALSAPILSLACPAWKDLTLGGEPLWDGIQDTFPGAKKAGSSL